MNTDFDISATFARENNDKYNVPDLVPTRSVRHKLQANRVVRVHNEAHRLLRTLLMPLQRPLQLLEVLGPDVGQIQVDVALTDHSRQLRDAICLLAVRDDRNSSIGIDLQLDEFSFAARLRKRALVRRVCAIAGDCS